jgi:hypothetical protein
MWYTDLLQENLKVVPDLDPDPKPVSKEDLNTSQNTVSQQNLIPVVKK